MKRSYFDTSNSVPAKRTMESYGNNNKNNLSLMDLPKSTAPKYQSEISVTCNESQFSSNNNNRPVSEKTYFFTGTPERVIKWRQMFNNHFCYFEVISTIVSLIEGNIMLQKMMLLKDKRGPILKVVFYENHFNPIEDLKVGQMIRCVGYMSSVNTLTAITIRQPTQTEIATLKRHCYIGDYTITGLLHQEEILKKH